MNCEVRLREEADRDLTEAALWYELHRPGLGHEFIDEAARALNGIAQHPLAYPVVWREIRRALLNRFPFGIFFRISNDTVVVLAIMHGSRHPQNWKGRK